MKNKLIVFVVMLLSLNASAQNRMTDSTEINLCKEWSIVKAVSNGVNIPMPSDAGKNGVIFYKDYTCDNFTDGEIEKGTWKYDSKTNTVGITIDNEEVVQLKILKLTGKSLVVEFRADGQLAEIELKTKD